MHSKLPKINELRNLFIALKPDIMDDFGNCDDEEGTPPNMDVTIGWSDDTGDWSYQTGPNDWRGDAYGYPHWGVINLNRRSNSTELAREVRRQLDELVWP